VKHLSGAPLYGRLFDLPTNIRPRLERLARDKHSTLLQKFVNYSHKKFYRIGSGGNKATVTKFYSLNFSYFFLLDDKLEHLSLASLYVFGQSKEPTLEVEFNTIPGLA
jgi:hypothetical protein